MSAIPINIVHVSPTPLVGAPAKIAHAQRMLGHRSISVVLADYPSKGPLAGKFIDDALVPEELTTPHIERAIRDADIIHVHNDLPTERATWLLLLNQQAKYVYHVHSPLREGPLYVDRASSLGLPFAACLVVGQHWPRLYPEFTPVPNIILHSPSILLRKNGEKLRVMFSPTHKHIGRWTSKHSKELDSALESLANIGMIDVIRPKAPVHPSTLMHLRRQCHVTIDEIATGGYHQVSIEGMCAGNVVINRSDHFGKLVFAKFAEGEIPPFTYADGQTIAELLLSLAQDEDLTRELQIKAYEYFARYLDPRRLGGFFDVVYRQVSQ